MASQKMRNRIACAGMHISTASQVYKGSRVSPRLFLPPNCFDFYLLAIQIPRC